MKTTLETTAPVSALATPADPTQQAPQDGKARPEIPFDQAFLTAHNLEVKKKPKPPKPEGVEHTEEDDVEEYEITDKTTGMVTTMQRNADGSLLIPLGDRSPAAIEAAVKAIKATGAKGLELKGELKTFTPAQLETITKACEKHGLELKGLSPEQKENVEKAGRPKWMNQASEVWDKMMGKSKTPTPSPQGKKAAVKEEKPGGFAAYDTQAKTSTSATTKVK